MNSLITQMYGLDRAFDQAWRGSCATTASVSDSDSVSTMRPKVDIFEGENEYRLQADLPGVTKQDLSIEVEHNVLSIAAERKRAENADLQDLHIERASNARFVRRFTLGESVDPDQIKAQFSNGVLELTIGKTEKALPRRISVE